MQIPFKKMHGTGNAILLLDQREQIAPVPNAQTLRQWANENSGPGFDQLMWLYEEPGSDVVASYRVFNADGSEVEQCGNGLRCVARYLADDGASPTAMTLGSPAGDVAAEVHADGRVSVSMGAPRIDAAGVVATLPTSVGELDVSLVSMGNPHCVLRVDAVDAAPVAILGPEIEHHSQFPDRINVGFAAILSREHIDLRVHERGAGETLACGTGACAAVVAGILRDWLQHDVRVTLPGGEVMVSWRGVGHPVWLTGNAEYVSHGLIDL